MEAYHCSMAAELHGSFREREALHAAHGVIGGEKQIQLALERNLEWVLDVGILPGVDVGFFRDHLGIGALGHGGGARDGYGLSGAGLHAFAREHVARSETPAAIGESAYAEAQRFAFGQASRLRRFWC